MNSVLKQDDFQFLSESNEDIFNFIQSDVLDGFWCWNFKTNKLFVNDKFWKLLGYDEKGFTIFENALLDLLHPEDRFKVEELIQELLKGSKHKFEYEVRYIHINGSNILVRCKGLVLKDESGNPEKIMGAHTKHLIKQAQIKTSQSADIEFQNIISQKGDCIIVFNPDYKIEGIFGDVNENGLNINYRKDKTQSIFEIELPASICEEIRDIIETSKESAANKGIKERRFIQLNNQEVCYEIFVSEADNKVSNQNLILCAIRKIESQISSASEKEETNRLLKDFMNASGELISIKDEQFRYIEVNDAFCNFYNRSKAELLGKTDYDFYDPAFCANIHERDIEIISGSKKITEITYEIDNRFIHVKKFPIPLSDRIWVGTIANDITEKKLSETKLRQYKELIESSSKLAKVGGWELDLTSNRLSWTDVTKAIHDLPEDYEPQLDTAINYYKEGPDRELIQFSVEKGIKYGTPWQVESRIITAMGREIWVRSIGIAEIKDGRCVRLYGAIQDINDRKIYQEQLKFHSYMLDQIGQAIIAVNPENKIIYWNKAAEDLYLWKQEEVIGKNVLDVTPASEYLPEASELIESLQKGEKYFGEALVKNKNGDHFIVNVINVPVLDDNGNIQSIVGLSHDITKEKEAEQKLRDSEEKSRLLAGFYKTLVENQSIYIIKTDANGNYTFTNEYFKKVFLDKDEVIGENVLQSILPEDHQACIDTVMNCIAEPGRSFPVLLKKPNSKGDVYTSKWEFKALFDANGNCNEILCVGIDFTELLNKQERLERLLEITANQNKKLLSFNYIVSHNIRSHVANLLGLTSYAELSNTDSSNKFLQMIKETSESLDETIQNLNLILDIQENKELAYADIPLKSEVKRIKAGIQMLFDNANATCEIRISEDEKIHANAAYMESILLNLMTNALKYRSKDRPLNIIFEMEKGDGHKTLVVTDNGRGMDMNRVKDKIFGMFKTFHGNQDAKGIGLFITKAQIEAMGGTIKVESEIEKGTTFKISFYD